MPLYVTNLPSLPSSLPGSPGQPPLFGLWVPILSHPRAVLLPSNTHEYPLHPARGVLIPRHVSSPSWTSSSGFGSAPCLPHDILLTTPGLGDPHTGPPWLSTPTPCHKVGAFLVLPSSWLYDWTVRKGKQRKKRTIFKKHVVSLCSKVSNDFWSHWKSKQLTAGLFQLYMIWSLSTLQMSFCAILPLAIYAAGTLACSVSVTTPRSLLLQSFCTPAFVLAVLCLRPNHHLSDAHWVPSLPSPAWVLFAQ